MVCFKDVVILFRQYSFCLEEDAAIQVIDSNTGAHFRFDKEWKLQLGGDFYGDDLSALLKKQVTEIEMREEGGVNIYINA